MMLRVIGKLGSYSTHPMIEHFKFVQSHTKQTPKMTIPSPSSLHFRYGRSAVPEAIYPDMADFYRDLGQSYRKAVRAFADAGCRYIQLDEVNFTYLCDPALRQQVTERGDDPNKLPHDYAKMINAAISDVPADMMTAMHLCRGNFQSTFVASGGYEPVAEILFNEINIQAYFMEYDTDRAGGFEPLRFVPKGKTVVLGLVTSKSGTLESKDELKRRIDQASKYISLDQLCLSPQCGFASTEEGNILAEDEQWAKLRMIVELADEVWGVGATRAIPASSPGLTRRSTFRRLDARQARGDAENEREAMQRTKPPFRADHVGSLLRSAALKDARAKRERGEITPEQLKAIEDREIETLIKKQEAIGLKSITDGENRRKSWQTDFISALPGIETYQGKRKVAFQGGVQPQQLLVRVARKLGDFDSHPMIEHFKFLKAHTKADAEDDDPVAVGGAFPRRPRRRAGLDLSRHGGFLPRSRPDLPQGGARLRRRRLPLSAARRGQPDLSLRSEADPAGARPRRESGGTAGRLRPDDQRGDVGHSRRHDHHHASVPRQFPLDLHRLAAATSRWRRPCSTPSTCTAISWSTTPTAPAASSRCASCRRASRWCSASSPRRPARWNPRTRSSAASTRRRSSCRIDQLCLSPQCGFASSEEGNVLAEEEQWAKLRMIVEIADEVWG